MTPEELEAIYDVIHIRVYWGDQSDEQLYARLNKYHDWIYRMSEHIEQQALALDDAEALIRKNAGMINDLLAQIRLLKEKLITSIEQPCHDECGIEKVTMTKENCKECRYNDAIKRIRAEMPEVFDDN